MSRPTFLNPESALLSDLRRDRISTVIKSNLCRYRIYVVIESALLSNPRCYRNSIVIESTLY